MKTAGLADNEQHRTELLKQLNILDSQKDTGFDQLVELTGLLFSSSMVAVSFVDKERQWFKSSIGLNICETTRDVSFCAHIVEKPQVMVIEDAMLDDRFFDNPLVTEQPFIRFYAGAPIRPFDNEVLGTLCLMDDRPRTFSAEEQRVLTLLAAQAEQLVLLHSARLQIS